MRGKKLNFESWGTQYLEVIVDGVESIYRCSGMKDFGKIKVETFIDELNRELKLRGEE